VTDASTSHCETGLDLHDIHKSFGGQEALRGISFYVAERETVAVLGPSGCGKSTLLAIIAGLETPDRGTICWEGASLQDTPPHRRDFGLMFQDFALFPHMKVFDNVAFGLKMKGYSPKQISRRCKEVLELVGLPGFELRDVNTLSGGEAQRVALARSLAPYPRLMMLDEPLGALDRTLRERLMVDLRRILTESRQTVVYVTHDQEEAFTVADRIVLMNQGQVVQIGTPQDLYRQPRTAFAARFLGLENLLPGKIEKRVDERVLATEIGAFPLEVGDEQLVDSDSVLVLLRPDAVRLGKDGRCMLDGVVKQVLFRGNTSRVYAEVNGLSFSFDFPASQDIPPAGQVISLSFDPSQAFQILPG
jgi:ABC-type Fe3+/spermidine/putrescine transport system ATPase subunit